ncbi:MAG TPA: DUF4055 domain-containing protein, partial [Actinomycetes bacterium]|nr:DUF4055 domain-containing protein [Actinomycetes bacterium]
VGPTAVSDKVEKPPLVDLADLNLSHYRTMADLEHGRHFVALPTPWLAGVPAAEKSDTSIALGAETVLILNQGGQCGMLEFSGAGLRALEKADDDKRSMMAALGARLLESPGKSSRETATSVEMRHAGEHATLRTIAQSCEQALTQVLRTHAWWAGEGGDLPNDFDSDEVKFELNKDFFSAKMDAPTLTAWVQALQAEAISYDTFWAAMTDGGLARPVSAEEELAQIHKQAAAAPGAQMPNAPAPLGAPGQKPGAPGPKVQDAGPGVKPGDVVAKDEGPYKLLNRAGRWLVVKADTGQPVKGGDHGADKKKALAHLAALAIATKGEGKGV